MAHPFWPLFDLEVRTPRLTLRYIDDAIGTELATVAVGGVHDAGWTPFAVPWTDAPVDEIGPNSFRHWWKCRFETSVDDWNINLAVIADGVAVGASGLGAIHFPTTRWFETGSWLGRDFQGRGLGTELRIATLHLGFLGFDARVAGTGAFSDNGPSLGVTRKLGYVDNGTEHNERRGEVAETHKFRMTRDHFMSDLRRDDIEIIGAEAARDFLGVSR